MEKNFAEYCADVMAKKEYKNVTVIDGREWSKTYATFGIAWHPADGGIKRAWTIMDLPMDILELESVCNWPDFPPLADNKLQYLNDKPK